MRELIKLLVDADDEMGRGDEMGEAFGDQPGNLAERLGGDQLAA